MRMHNPPHPGLVLARVSGRNGRIHSRGPSAGHASDSFARAERQGGDVGCHGPPVGGILRYFPGTVDEHAVTVRPLAG